MPLIELILPDFIIENYLLTHVEKSGEVYHVYLEEKIIQKMTQERASYSLKAISLLLLSKISQFEGIRYSFILNVADGSILRQVK